jgi:uncharacterized membrane protein YkvA (DUF1232 family)
VKLLRTLSAARRELPRVLPLMRDSRVPAWAKAVALAAAALILSPLDLLGDIPVLGLVDDVALLLFVIHLFVSFAERQTAPKQIVRA